MKTAIDVDNIKMEEVSSIPDSRWKRKKGVSKYDSMLRSFADLPIGKPMKLKSPHVKPLSLYSSLSELFKARKIKFMRIVTRGKDVYVERLF